MNSITESAQSDNYPFDSIRRTDDNGQEYWLARELMKVLGYSKWQRFEDAIERATISCEVAGDLKALHFNHLPGSVSGSGRTGDDYKLSRRACYLVAVNGDVRKTEIAQAQKYFGVKAYEAEINAREAQIITADSFDSLTSGQVMGIRNALENPDKVSPDEFAVLTDGISQALVSKIGALNNDQYVKLYLTLRNARVPQDIQDQKDTGLFTAAELKIADKTIERFDRLQEIAGRKWQQAIGSGTSQKALEA